MNILPRNDPLTAAELETIQMMIRVGDVTQTKIARKFRIPVLTVRRIQAGMLGTLCPHHELKSECLICNERLGKKCEEKWAAREARWAIRDARRAEREKELRQKRLSQPPK